MKGTISRLISDKGFGFIKGADGVERFFHMSAVRGTTFAELTTLQPVEFDDERGDKGPRATNVRTA